MMPSPTPSPCAGTAWRRPPSRPGLGAGPLTLAALLAALIILPGGCAGEDGPATRVTRADDAQCRAIVSSAYDRQNRADILRGDQRDSPFAAGGTQGVLSAGLGTQFGYNQEIRSCERGSAANVGGSNTTGQATATPTITVVPPR
jgi:hypothetical protein